MKAFTIPKSRAAQRRLAARPDLTEDELKAILTCDGFEFRDEIMKRPDFPASLQTFCLEKGICHRELAARADLLSEVQLEMARIHAKKGWGTGYYLYSDCKYDPRIVLAERTDILPEVQEIILSSYNYIAKEYLAENPAISDNTQRQLVRDESYDVRACLASNPRLLPELFETLASDISDDTWWTITLQRLADNTDISLPADIQRKLLSEDCSFYARMNMASNPRLLPELQMEVAESHCDKMIKECLAKNPSLTPEAKAALGPEFCH